MSGVKRFGTQLNGYNKEDVNDYIDTMIDTFKGKIAQRETEVIEIKSRYDAVCLELEETKMQLEIAGRINAPEPDEEFHEQKIIAAVKDARDKARKDFMGELNEINKKCALISDENNELRTEKANLLSEIDSLRGRLVEINDDEKNEITVLREELIREKDKLAHALFRADELAVAIVDKANKEAEMLLANANTVLDEERKNIESIIESEKEKIVDIKRDVRDLSSTFVALLKKYEQDLKDTVFASET